MINKISVIIYRTFVYLKTLIFCVEHLPPKYIKIKASNALKAAP